MTQSRFKTVFGTVFLLVIAVVTFVMAAVVATSGDLGAGVLMAGFSVYLAALIIAAMVFGARPRAQHRDRFRLGRTGTGEPALLAPAPRGKVTAGLAFLVVSAAASLGLAFLTALGGGIGTLILTIAAGGLPASVALAALRGRLHRGHLALSPSGIEVQSWQEGVYLPWSEMAEVCMTAPRRRPLHVLVMLDTTEPESSAVRRWHCPSWWLRISAAIFNQELRVGTIVVESYGVHVDVIMALLWHYWTHPQQRDELATQAGVQRLIQHQLADPEFVDSAPQATAEPAAEPQHNDLSS